MDALSTALTTAVAALAGTVAVLFRKLCASWEARIREDRESCRLLREAWQRIDEVQERRCAESRLRP
jgi:hypothetical protein